MHPENSSMLRLDMASITSFTHASSAQQWSMYSMVWQQSRQSIRKNFQPMLFLVSDLLKEIVPVCNAKCGNTP
jgi:hypothetical protein